MTLQEKIQKKAEGYGKLAPVFLEGAKFVLENQWISVKDGLPCNHEELLINNKKETKTVLVIVNGRIIMGSMYKKRKWHWFTGTGVEPTHWMPLPELPKEQEIK